MIVRAYPLVASVEEVERFAAVLRNRSAETTAFYLQFGVSHESWHVQATSEGMQLITVTIVDNPGDAAPRYAAANEEFVSWFKQQVLRLSGIDPNIQPLGPPSKQVFAWEPLATT
jgi:hypothetical protein